MEARVSMHTVVCMHACTLCDSVQSAVGMCCTAQCHKVSWPCWLPLLVMHLTQVQWTQLWCYCVPPAPLAVAADNAKFYADNGVSFVMGTTGGDPAVVAAAAEAAGVYAVVSPQMGKQVRQQPCDLQPTCRTLRTDMARVLLMNIVLSYLPTSKCTGCR